MKVWAIKGLAFKYPTGAAFPDTFKVRGVQYGKYRVSVPYLISYRRVLACQIHLVYGKVR